MVFFFFFHFYGINCFKNKNRYQDLRIGGIKPTTTVVRDREDRRFLSVKMNKKKNLNLQNKYIINISVTNCDL